MRAQSAVGAPLRRAWCMMSVLAMAVPAVSGAPAGEVITNASKVLALTPEQAARNIPVSITGVVTVAEPTWKGMFFVQDSTAGVFVNSKEPPGPIPGDVVEV